MGIFTSPKKRVSRREFDELRKKLFLKGFNEHDIDDIKKIFRGDLDEATYEQSGIDAKELSAALKWMRGHMRDHTLSNEQINVIEEEFNKYL